MAFARRRSPASANAAQAVRNRRSNCSGSQAAVRDARGPAGPCPACKAVPGPQPACSCHGAKVNGARAARIGAGYAIKHPQRLIDGAVRNHRATTARISGAVNRLGTAWMPATDGPGSSTLRSKHACATFTIISSAADSLRRSPQVVTFALQFSADARPGNVSERGPSCARHPRPSAPCECVCPFDQSGMMMPIFRIHHRSHRAGPSANPRPMIARCDHPRSAGTDDRTACYRPAPKATRISKTGGRSLGIRPCDVLKKRHARRYGMLRPRAQSYDSVHDLDSEGPALHGAGSCDGVGRFVEALAGVQPVTLCHDRRSSGVSRSSTRSPMRLSRFRCSSFRLVRQSSGAHARCSASQDCPTPYGFHRDILIIGDFQRRAVHGPHQACDGHLGCRPAATCETIME